MNEFLATVPFDLYQLHLFQLVARHRSFTRAAEAAGLTQSAITRQIQTMEAALGVPLLERTTRSVVPTPAGRYLQEESFRLVGDVDATLTGFRERFCGARPVVRVGVSRSIALAHLPGFFHANLRRRPEVGCRVVCRPSADILTALLGNELDLGVMCRPARLPSPLNATHRIEDEFTLVVPAGTVADGVVPRRGAGLRKWIEGAHWLLPDEGTTTGCRLRAWMRKQGWTVEPSMELDGFDLIINLVSLGMGVAFVPVRALALYPNRKTLRRVPLDARFSRDLVVVRRRHASTPPHIGEFIDNILF